MIIIQSILSVAQAASGGHPSFDWNPVVVIVAAVIGAVATLAAVYPQLRSAKRATLATYLEAISASLSGMAAAFSRREVPYEDGHRFEGLIKNYEISLKPYFGHAALADLSRFESIAQRSESADQQIEGNLVADSDELYKLINDLRRIAGEMAAKAQEIRLS